MALNADNVTSGIYTGAMYWAPAGSPLPTGLNSPLPSEYEDMGFIGEEGPELTLPAEEDSTPVRVWQNAAIIRTIRTPSDESPSWQIPLVENKPGVVELALNTKVTQTPVAGEYVINGNAPAEHGILVLDVITANSVRRYVGPNAIRTALEALSFPNDGTPQAYNVTIATDYSPEIDGEMIVWDTALRSGAGRGGLTGNHADEAVDGILAGDFAGNPVKDNRLNDAVAAKEAPTAPTPTIPASEIPDGSVPLYAERVVEDVQQVVDDVAHLAEDYNEAVVGVIPAKVS